MGRACIGLRVYVVLGYWVSLPLIFSFSDTTVDDINPASS